jgi:TonB family protein
MNTTTFLSRLTVVLLITVVSSIPAFCGAIHYAAAAGDLEEVKALLEKNPELVSSKDERGWMPLHTAAWNVRKDMVELLLSMGADVNAKNSEGETPLHLAAQKSDRHMVELLLAKKADVKAKNNRGKTPLDVASEFVADLLQPDGTPPVLLMSVPPPLTEEARKASICGILIIRATIRANGTVDSFKVIKGLGYGMEESAINTIATKWRFKPATKNGVPIDTECAIEGRFECR